MTAARALVVIVCIVLITFVSLFWSADAAAQLLTPGPLTRAHASLEGDAKCSTCHSSGKRVETPSCLSCHSDLAARVSAGLGLHGREYKGRPCEGCHVEHQGVGSRLIRWPGGDPSKLDHALTGWALQNAHKSAAACALCHSRTNARGAPTFLGLSGACNSCHKDPHDNRFGQVCSQCHDDAAWKNIKLTSFNHELARFKLRGAHQRVVCAKCHTEPGVFVVGTKYDTCASCHKDPHAGKLGSACAGCHSENGWKPASFKSTAHPVVSLANGHSTVACKTCHDRGDLIAPSRGSECVSCHKPVHKAPFGSACAACHQSILWIGLPASIGLGAHNRTAYPLSGRHAQTPCAGCHRPELSRLTRYRSLKFGRCADCHGDEHRGEFAKSDFGVDCKQCHTTIGFRPTSFGIAMHAKTSFPLSGKHNATACSGCHQSTRPQVNLRVKKQECADCHSNPHGDHFATEMKDGGCAHCHKSAGWDLPKFEHAMWPLTGAHTSARCESCHTPSPEDKKSGHGPSWRGLSTKCASCHDDTHAGQFARAECDSCHTTTAFKIAKLDHAVIARYPLTGNHVGVACEKCHALTKLKDGTEIPRWRLPSNQCSYCHADPHVKKSVAGR